MKQGDGGSGGSAGGKKIVHEQYFAAGLYGIDVDRDGVGTVFQVVGFFVRHEREFSFFANGDKARLKLERGRCGKNETARIDAHDGIDSAGDMILGKQVDGAGEKPRDPPEPG